MAKVSVRNRNKNKFYKDGSPKPPNYEYRFEKAPVNGKRQHGSQAGFKTQKEAFEAGTKALAEYLNGGTVHAPNSISVNDYLNELLQLYVKTQLKPYTYDSYKRIIKNHINPALGHYKLQSITAPTLQGFINGYQHSGLSKARANAILSVLKSAFYYAVEPLKYLKDSPATRLRMPKMDDKPNEKDVVTPSQWQQITCLFPAGNKYHMPLMIGYYTGLRISEVLGLTWDDIDLENNLISVNKQQIKHTFDDETVTFCFGAPKTSTSERIVRIGDTLAAALKQEQARQKKQRLLYGEYFKRYSTRPIENGKLLELIEDASGNVDLVCTWNDGKLLMRDTLRHCAKRIRCELNINFSFHALRHSHATLLAENGVNPKSLQKRLGHKRIETTLQTYIHDTERMSGETVDTFENAARGQK